MILELPQPRGWKVHPGNSDQCRTTLEYQAMPVPLRGRNFEAGSNIDPEHGSVLAAAAVADLI